MAEDSSVLVSVDAATGAGTLVLNRPEKRNALDGALVAAAHDGLRRLVADREVSAIVIRGNGPAFCAGADLQAIRALATATLEQNLEDSRRLRDFILALCRSPKPTIAAVHGPALAGGAGIASACDFVVASPEATFGYPEVKIGFVAAIVMVLLARQVGERRARELLLTGRVVDAREAMELGLITRLVPPELLDGEVAALVKQLRAGSPSAQALTKRLLEAQWSMSFEEALEVAAAANAEARGTAECKEGVAAFLDKRRPKWRDV